jgi:hypothetical protein
VATGAADAFVARFAPDGELSWFETFGTGNRVVAVAVAVDPPHLFVSGSFEGALTLGPGCTARASDTVKEDLFLAKLEVTPAGSSCVWAKAFPDASADGRYAIGIDACHDVFWAGSFRGTLELDQPLQSAGGGADIFLAKLAP